jgi:CheY-like chemotaxis protein
MMPGLDGPRTLHALRTGPLGATVPIVFLTAKVAKTECQRLLALGAAGVMTKPFDPLTLSAGLESILEPQVNSHRT